MMKSIFLERSPDEQRTPSKRLEVIAERLSYVIEYLAADDLRNWAAADLCACGDVSPQDLSELEAVISAAFRSVPRRASQSAGMRYATVWQ